MSALDLDQLFVAQMCHEANRAYCESIGDTSQVPWDDAPDWQKESALSGVRFHWDLSHGVADSHDNWMKQKFVDGWEYGEIKDPVAKTHPCLVEYDCLPIEQKVKDHIFRNIVHGWLNAVLNK